MVFQKLMLFLPGVVEPEQVDDKMAEILANDISGKIKESMEYPGNIKVCVIRNTVASKFTQEYEEEGIKENV